MRRYRSYSRPQVRTITVKYAGNCVCCGARIDAGSIADYYPAGTIAGISEGKLAHHNGLNGNSAICSEHLKANRGLNDFAGDGLDSRYEDDCKDICGL